jgi:hypothetical protein
MVGDMLIVGVMVGVMVGVIVVVGVGDNPVVGVIDGVLVMVGVVDDVLVIVGVIVVVGVIDLVGVIVGVIDLVGVIVGVIDIVGVGVTSQSVTVATTPLPSNVTAYLNDPSIINEYPPGFDVYVGVVKPESLYIINPFVIVNVLSMYFVRPVVPAQVDGAST